MKPRVLMSIGDYRLVRVGRWSNKLEKSDGIDAMRRTRWVSVPPEEITANAWSLLDRFADQIYRRELRARKHRHRRARR